MINICSRCNSVMVIRRRQSDNAQFWGCSGFPKCKYTEPMDRKPNAALDVELFQESTLAAMTCCDRVAAAVRAGTEVPAADALACAEVLRVILKYVEFWKSANDPQIWDTLHKCEQALKASAEVISKGEA